MGINTLGIRRFPLLFVLICLAANGLIASDINLPAMPVAAQSLHVSLHDIQYSFSLYVVGLAFSQAFVGPFSDRIGRRACVIVGLAIFIAASIGCALAPSPWVFDCSRLVQALGAGAGTVLGRALVGDCFERKDAARVLTTIMPIVGMSPAISPTIGGLLTTYINWRAPFVFIVLLGFATLVVAVVFVPETHPVSKRADGFLSAAVSYPMLAGKSLFWAYAINLGVAYSVYLGYLAASPALLTGFGLDTTQRGFCYIALAASYVGGNLWSRHLALKHPLDRLLMFGFTIFIFGAVVQLGFGFTGSSTIWSLSLAMAIMTLGNGFLIPLSYAGGLNGFPTIGGAVSGLMGTVQLASAGVAIAFVSHYVRSPLDFALFAFFVAVVGALAFPFLLRLGHAATTAAASGTPAVLEHDRARL